MKNKVTLIGAFCGFVAFLFVGLLPSLIYGGYSGVLLATGIFGTPLPTHIFANGLILFGMVLGVIGVGGLFIVMGAALASLIYAIVK